MGRNMYFQLMRVLAVGFLLTAFSPVSRAQLQTKKALTLEAAKKIAAAAEQHARKNNWPVAITILDDGGQLLYFQKMDGVQIASIEVSSRKAECALKFRRPSKAFAERAVKEPYVIAMPGAFPVEGGLPLMVGTEVIGSIGVSGATSEQDGMIAKAGTEVLAQMADK